MKVDLTLKEKTVVVTGASKGLGKAIAIEFAKEGHLFLYAAVQKNHYNVLLLK